MPDFVVRKRDYGALKRMTADLARGVEPKVNASELAMSFADPLPHERAVRILSRCFEYAANPSYTSVTWENQLRAAEFYNTNGLSATLSKCVELDPTSLDPPECSERPAGRR